MIPYSLKLLLFFCLTLFFPSFSYAQERDARKIIEAAIDHWRGETSYTLAKMLVHREGWQRKSELESWTKGSELTLVRFIAPKKDAGNASLSVADEVWTFAPKTNRVIKIPPSMKSQSWMGSDFSYRDLSKDDEIIDSYTHKLLAVEESEGKKVYLVESVPLESAPIVWGKEVLKIREDNIILEHTFYDQEMLAVKKLVASEIVMLGGKLLPRVLRMQNLEEEEKWTQIIHEKARFSFEIADSFFTVSNLQNPR